VFKEHLLVTCAGNDLLVLDPDSITVVAMADELRGVLDFAVTKDEIFVLEGKRSIVRIACQPETAPKTPDEGGARPLAATAVSSLRELRAPLQKVLSALALPSAFHNKQPEQPALAVEALELPPITPLHLHLPYFDPGKERILEPIGLQDFEEVLFRGRSKKTVDFGNDQV
jgi:hypothetical protein